MLRTSIWLMFLGVAWQCSDGAHAQLFRRHVQTLPRVYYAPGPGGCVDESAWGTCRGPGPCAVYTCDGYVIWLWDAGDACCQPGQPSGKQVPPAAAKPKPADKPPHTVLKPLAKLDIKKDKPPTPPPAESPANPTAPKVEPPPPAAKPELKDIETMLRAKGGFEKLLAAAKVARALEELVGGPFTVFAPTDDAFAKLDPLVLERLMANPDKLHDLLLYHALAGKLTADEALLRGSVKTVQGSDARFRQDGARRLVNDAEVTERDITCTNGVVHVIDRVLFPQGFEPPAAAAPAKPPAGAAATKPAAEGQSSEPKAP